MSMVARVEPAVLALFRQGFRGGCKDLTAKVFASDSQVRNVLAELKRQGKIRVCEWRRSKFNVWPIYEFMTGVPSLPKPRAMTAQEQSLNYRRNHPAFCAKEAELKRRKKRRLQLQGERRQEVSEWLSVIRQTRT